MKFLLLYFLFPVLVLGQTHDTTSFIFVGDIMGHGPQIVSAQDSIGNYNFEEVYKYIKPVLNQYDFVVGNLELTLSDKGKYTGYPRFRSPDILAKNLKDAGFDLLTTANNHSNDGFKYGVEHTIEQLNEVGIEHTGTFCDSFDYLQNYPLIQKINNLNVVFLNYTYGTNGLPTKTPTIVNIIDEKQIKLDIIKAKKLNPDVIITLLHWGWEYNIYPNNFQKKIAKLLFDNGVDVIIGGHPHVVQPIKCRDNLIDSLNNKNYIAYSLGNFISNQQKAKTDGGIMLDLRIVKTSNGIEIIEPKYIPIWRYIKKVNKKLHFFVLPISKLEYDSTYLEISAGDKLKMKKFVKNIRNHLYMYECSERKLK